MFFKRKNSMAEYGAFDMNSIDQMSGQYQTPSYYLDPKFIRNVIIIVASLHVLAIGYFALEGLIKELFKENEQSITVELSDFAAYSPVTSDGPQTTNNNEIIEDNSKTEDNSTPVDNIPTPNVPDEFKPVAATQPMFNQPSLVATR